MAYTAETRLVDASEAALADKHFSFDDFHKYKATPNKFPVTRPSPAPPIWELVRAWTDIELGDDRMSLREFIIASCVGVPLHFRLRLKCKFPATLNLASFPGSRTWEEERGLVHTVRACAKFPW